MKTNIAFFISCLIAVGSAAASPSNSSAAAPGGSSPSSAPSAAPAGGSSPSASSAAPAGGSSPSSASSAAPAGGSSSGGSSGGSGTGPTYEQFCAAVDGYSKTGKGNPPKPSQDLYKAYTENVGKKLSMKEQAQFLANSIWETGGLQYMKEIACSNGSCTYGKYYGRGFLQLTWDYNYKTASQDIYGNTSLVDNPDLASQPDGAWKTAVWFWNKNVKSAVPQSAIDGYELGHSVKKINGALECPANDKAQNRLKIYNNILDVWGIAKGSPGKLTGC